MRKLINGVGILCSLMLLCSMFTGLSFSVDAATSGDYEYSLCEDNTAEITGYTGSATDLIIPSTIDGYTVTSIGDFAFDNCTSLTSITIPEGVTSIGWCAFVYCTNLESITIPDSVTEIDYDAFENTAWYDNQPDGVVYAGKVLYEYKGEMPQNTTITVKDGTKGIGDYAFDDCTNLISITIPDSVTEIGSSAFENTAWYDNQPDGVVYVGKVLYEYKGEMPQNTTITVKDGTKGIGDYAFSGCTNLTSITIPDSVTGIGDWTFTYCTSLTSVTIPNSVTSIGFQVFSECTSLTSITIPNSVTSIGFQAFSGCTSLTSITIPASVKYIGDHAFGYYYDDEYNEVKIDDLTITGYSGSAAETYANENGFEFVSLDNAPTTEPDESSTPTNPTDSSENTEPSTSTEATDSTVVTDPTEGTIATEPTEGTTATEPSETQATQPTTKAPAKTTVSLAKSSASIYVKGTATIKATVKNSKSKTTYKSSNTKIAKVSSTGKVTGVKKGTAKITVTNNGVSKTFKVTVNNPKLNKKSTSIKKGKSFTLKITGKVGKAKYVSSNKKVATVNKKGKITGKKKGKATITVTTNGIKLKCKVTVK